MKILIALISILLLVNVVGAAEVNKGLNLENVVANPEKLVVTSNFSLSGQIRNIADRELDSIRLTFKGGFPFSKTSPLFSLYIDKLRQNQVYPFSVNLSIDKDAAAKEYPLDIIADYYVYDSAVSKSYNTIRSETLTATITVDKGVDFKISGVSFPQKIMPDVKDALIVINLENGGITAAKEVKLNLAAQYPFVPSGKSYFISEIKPGDTKEAIFHVDVDSAASSQTYPIDLFVEWREEDAKYSDTKTFGIPVERSSVQNILPFPIRNEYVLGIIAIVVLALMIFRMRKKRRSR